jgi:hypothetical protein
MSENVGADHGSWEDFQQTPAATPLRPVRRTSAEKHSLRAKQLADHVSNPAIVRTDEHDSVVAFLYEKGM